MRLFEADRAIASLQGRDALLPGNETRTSLIAQRAQRGDGRTNERDALLFAAIGEIRILAEEPPAWMDGVALPALCDIDDLFDIQVRCGADTGERF